jgi:hypothetical protein
MAERVTAERKHVAPVHAEVHATGFDISTQGRAVTVLFRDGVRAVAGRRDRGDIEPDCTDAAVTSNPERTPMWAVRSDPWGSAAPMRRRERASAMDDASIRRCGA